MQRRIKFKRMLYHGSLRHGKLTLVHLPENSAGSSSFFNQKKYRAQAHLPKKNSRTRNGDIDGPSTRFIFSDVCPLPRLTM
jgi:hypothetical protein